MRLSDRTKSSRQRGASLVEFCFTIPVLLLVAGSTVDLSRYMRFLQVTTFVSQETAEQIYRQCSDITIYTPADINTTSLQINQGMTESAIANCVSELQTGAQHLLNAHLGRAAVSSKVFRWNITQTSSAAVCGGVTTIPSTQVTVIGAKGDVDCDDLEHEENENDDNNQSNDSPPQDPSRKKRSRISERSEDKEKSGRNREKLDEITRGRLETEGIALRHSGNTDGIYQTISTSGSARLLVSPSTLCQKSRVATVEVSYAFEPIVKFLPNLMIKLNNDGSQRETTAL